MTNTFKSSTHDINIYYGLSVKYISHDNSPSRERTRQRIWPKISVIISDILLTIIREKRFGLDTLSCLLQLTLDIACVDFVDDMYITNAAKLVNIRGDDPLKQ